MMLDGIEPFGGPGWACVCIISDGVISITFTFLMGQCTEMSV